METDTQKQAEGLRIVGVAAGSIAEELSLPDGTRILAVDGELLQDVFQFRLLEDRSELTLLCHEEAEGLFELEIEKDEDEPLGFELEVVPRGQFTHCHNGCLFCFIDQLPKGLRSTLYFKDDDLRLSFLHGNYVSLTNVSDRELERLIALRFSPLNVSVHTTDPELRQRLMQHPKAGRILEQLKKIAAAGLELNIQIVLCPDLNDGPALDRTLQELMALGPQVTSIAVVPVGLTRYRDRNRLAPLRPFTDEECAAVVHTIQDWQQKNLHACGRRTIFPADELLLRADLPLPPAVDYESFLQLENGVGMVRRFKDDLQVCLRKRRKPRRNQAGPVVITTGTLMAPLWKGWLPEIETAFGLPLKLVAVENEFFGHSISVAGLLTGQDLLRRLSLEALPEDAVVLIPTVMLKQDAPVFLDDLSLSELADGLQREVMAVPATAGGLCDALLTLGRRKAG